MDRTAIVRTPDTVDAAWLTEVLQGHGYSAPVRHVRVDAGGSTWAQNARLHLEYEGTDSGPSSLFLKTCGGRDNLSNPFGRAEVDFYTQLYVDCTGAPIPRCYDAAYADPPRCYHLLLEDLTATHSNTFERAPDLALGYGVVDGLARLHAHHWGVPPDAPAQRDAYYGHIERAAPHLKSELHGPLARSIQPIEDLLAYGRQTIDRYLDAPSEEAAVTYLHGDLNPGNILAPRTEPGPYYLIDHQPFDWSFRRWFAGADLANFMGLHWSTEGRRVYEMPVLHRYRASMAALGIDIEPERLLLGYRLGLLHTVEAGIEWLIDPVDRVERQWLWQMLLTRAMAAYEDHRCAELLGR